MNLQIYHEIALILGGFDRTAPAPRISIAPWETASTVLDLAAGIAIFLAAATLLRSRSRRRLFSGTIVVSAALTTLTLALPALTRPGTSEVDPRAADAAAFLGIALCVAFAALWAEILTNADRGADSPDAAERFERRISPIAIRVVLWLATAAGLLLCGVTSAMLAAALAILLLLALSVRRRRSDFSRRAAVIALLVFAAGPALVARSNPEDGAASKPLPAQTTWTVAIDAFRHSPYVGSGLGTFPDAFRREQPRNLPGLIMRADSALLELLVTGGIAGAALATLVVLSLLILLARAWRSQRHREETAMTLAGLGALVFWALASLGGSVTTSSTALPAIAAVCGMSWAASQARGVRLL